MKNIDNYNNVFIEILGVDEGELAGLKYQDVPEWDSIGHMSLVSEFEDVFEIQMETDDIISFSSYEDGKTILAAYGVEF